MNAFFSQYPLLYKSLLAAGSGAIAGAVGAARVDYMAFKEWKSLDDAKHYDWGKAVWRWFHGAIVGAVGGVSLVLTSAGFTWVTS